MRMAVVKRMQRTNAGNTDDVWPRFERLAQCCKIVVDHGAVWRVNIRPRDSEESVDATGTDLLKTVQKALDEAEGRGWDRPARSG
jgi:hypothetical protein